MRLQLISEKQVGLRHQKTKEQEDPALIFLTFARLAENEKTGFKFILYF